MNLEPQTTDCQFPLPDAPSPGMAPEMLPSQQSTSALSAIELEGEGEESRLARAATLLIGTAEVQPRDCETCELSTPALKYVQGIVQSQRVHLITNLVSGESQTLYQPQMVWTIGRNREAALPLQDRAMSRRHAVILYLPNAGFQLIDLNSMNGSFVNGNRLQQRAWLKDGDRVRLGSSDFTFFLSCSNRYVGPVHPEVLTRFNAAQYRPGQFMDYSALEEPEIFFNVSLG